MSKIRESVKVKASRFCGKLCIYGATAGLMVAPFVIDTVTGKAVIIASLLILSIQMIRVKAWNMVLANTVSIAGYLWSLTA